MTPELYCKATESLLRATTAATLINLIGGNRDPRKELCLTLISTKNVNQYARFNSTQSAIFFS